MKHSLRQAKIDRNDSKFIQLMDSKWKDKRPEYEHLLRKLVDKIQTILEAQDNYPLFNSHVKGVTGKTANGHAFIFIDLQSKGMSVKFYTGTQVDGILDLEKANWETGDDYTGSEVYHISKQSDLFMACVYANVAFHRRIAESK